jgi:hypothetical protein
MVISQPAHFNRTGETPLITGFLQNRLYTAAGISIIPDLRGIKAQPPFHSPNQPVTVIRLQGILEKGYHNPEDHYVNSPLYILNQNNLKHHFNRRSVIILWTTKTRSFKQKLWILVRTIQFWIRGSRMKSSLFWDVTPCSLVESQQTF